MRLGLLLLAAGVVVVALPDDGERLFSLSEGHGPSVLDAFGIVVLLAGWVLLLRIVWRARARFERRFVALGGGVMAIGAAILVASIAADAGSWWLVGVALMAAPQAAALGVAGRA